MHLYGMRGLRLQKRINLLGAFRLNVSKSGIGLSAGLPGLRAGIDAKARRYTSMGLPGTGISKRTYSKHPALHKPMARFVWVSALIVAIFTALVIAYGSH